MEQQGQHAESLAELESLARTSGVTPQLLVHLARGLRFAGRAAEAEQQLEAALRSSPTDLKLHGQLAQLRWSRGAGEASTQWIESAIERFPARARAAPGRGRSPAQCGHTGKALSLLEGGLALAPDSVAFLTSIGVLLDDLGRPEEALRLSQGRRGACSGCGFREAQSRGIAAASRPGRGGTTRL
jgi:Flp pilus assembly protein TadD